MTPILSQPRLRIMLADADFDFYIKMTLLLDEVAPRRFELEWASTYGFGVSIVRRQKFCLCLISSHIGHRSGLDLAAQIKSGHPEMPIIMLAGSEEIADIPAGQPLDCLDRNRLSVEMLRQAVRDAVFRSTGRTPLVPASGRPAASELAQAAV